MIRATVCWLLADLPFMRAHSRLLTLLISCLASGSSLGCGQVTGAPTLEIGHDDGTALSEGEVLLIEAIEGEATLSPIALRVDAVDPIGGSLWLRGLDAATGAELISPFTLDLSAADVSEIADGWWIGGIPLDLLEPDPTLLSGRSLRLEIELRPADGSEPLSTALAVALGFPRLRLGRNAGGESFVPLQEDDDLALFMGIQGGYHILVSVKAEYFPYEDVTLRLSGEGADDGSILTLSPTTTLSENRVVLGDQSWTRFDQLLIMLTFNPADVIGERLLIEATAHDPAIGVDLQSSVTVNIAGT